MRHLKLSHLMFGAATAALAFQAQTSQAQVDNNFNRDRSVAVNDRAKDEYTPLGIRWDTFMVRPQLGASLETNSNVFYTQTAKKSDTLLELQPGVEVTSDWNRHSLGFGFTSSIYNYNKFSSENVTDYDLHANGRIDISSAASISGGVVSDHSTESRSVSYANPNAVKPVPVDTNAVNLGTTIVGNRLRFIGEVSAGTTSYKDVAGAPNEHSRDLNTYDGSGRLDYAVSPDTSVYVFVEGNSRKYKTVTANNSTGSIYAVGTSFDLSKLIRGDVQVGSLSQDYKTLAAGKQTTTYYNGKVEWFPTELTTVTGSVGRSYTDAPAATGVVPLTALTTTTGLTLDHELLRNLILSAGVSQVDYDYKGVPRKDTDTSLHLGGRYFLNRRVVLAVNYNHEDLKSVGTQAFRSYKDDVLQLGLVLNY